MSDPFEFVPDEVLEFLLGYLSPYGDLRNVAQVNKRFCSAIRNVMQQQARDFARSVQNMTLVWSSQSYQRDKNCPSITDERVQEMSGLEITKRYSHSTVYDDKTLSMYVFGGCTSSSTTFNDLWKLDLTTRRWTKPLATGTYPSPKACSVLVLDEKNRRLLLFGGWTHPSLYPLHQTWRLFNELHQYEIEHKRWVHVLPNSSLKPPSMAGHSATIHNGVMVIFGGLHKQRSSIGQFSSSNDVWCFDLSTNCWHQTDIPEPRPNPRYGQSQLFIDENHLLILGGCGGPNNIFTDVWLLIMELPHWRWVKCEILNSEHAANHMWCHPAVKVNNYAVVLGKNKAQDKSTNLSESETAQFNVIPQLRRGMNRGYGSIRRQNNEPPRPRASAASQAEDPRQRRNSTSSESSDQMDTSNSQPEHELSVEPITDDQPTEETEGSSSPEVFKTSVKLNINPKDVEQPSTSSQQESPPQPPQPSCSFDRSVPSYSSSAGRLAAFNTGVPTTYTSTSSFKPSSNTGAIPKNQTRQMENWQNKLKSLKKMEEKIKAMGNKSDNTTSEKINNNNNNREKATVSKEGCLCHRLAMHVLDLTHVLDSHLVAWVDLKSNASLHAPEETILYTLVKGRAELIMFGGIQKDVSSMTSRNKVVNCQESTSNSVYFLNLPKTIV